MNKKVYITSMFHGVTFINETYGQGRILERGPGAWGVGQCSK